MTEHVPEPQEGQLPDKPAVPDVVEDTSVPGELPVPEEEFMDPAAADADEQVDTGETEVEGDQPKYDGGEIPPAPASPEPVEQEQGEQEPAPEPAQQDAS